MLNWHFKNLDPDCVDDVCLAEKNFSRESTDFPQIFIREVVQNVLDARDDKHKGPVRLALRIIDQNAGMNADKFREVFHPLEEHLKASDHKLPRDYTQPRVLVVEEFGTIGLTGQTNNSRAKGVNERWANFWHGEGKRSKGGKSLGRAGQGKIAYHMASAARSLLALSGRKTDEPQQCVFGKCIVKNTHQLGGKHFMRHGYWRQVQKDLGVQPLPATAAEFIAQFREDFRLERGDGQAGTSWVIPFPVESLTQEALIRAVLTDFHFSVLKGALAVNVFGVEIDQDTISGLIAEHLRTNVISQQFVSFLTDIITSDGKDTVLAKPAWKFDGATLDESAFSEDEFGKLKAAFEAGKMVSVRFPVVIAKLDGSAPESFFDVHLGRPEHLERTEELYVRSDLVIGDERWLKDAAGKNLGVVIAEDEGLSEFLGNAEEASHLKWNAAEDELKSRYKMGEARDLLSRVRNSLPKLCRLLAGRVGGMEEDALRHILSIPDKNEGKKKAVKSRAKKAKEGQNEEEEEEVERKRNPKPFEFNDVASGISIRAGDAKLPSGTTAKLRFAYANVVGEGNPFSHYHPFDFDLADEAAIKITVIKGLTIISRSENLLVVQIDDPAFKVIITGFSQSYRLVCRARTAAEAPAEDMEAAAE